MTTDDQIPLIPGPTSVPGPRGVSTTPQQYKVIARAREDGSISPATAGRILHEHRGSCGFGAKGGRHTDGKSEACCAYASSDGLEALKRLVRRGLLVHTAKGRYEPTEVPEWKNDREPTLMHTPSSGITFARARRTDPSTSHEAAASHAPLELNAKRSAVLDHLRMAGPQPDETWIASYQSRIDRGGEFMPQSPSGLRTRRAELVEMGLIEAVGETKIRNRRVIVWGVKA